jgi:hypothetical protein
MTVTIFFEDFDGNGIGFGDSGYDMNPFDQWGVGGNAPPGFGEWVRFSGDATGEDNLTPGTGGYAGIRIFETLEFGENTYWLVSPLIDTRHFTDLELSLDLHYEGSGGPGEATLRVILLRAGDPPETIDIIGDTLSNGEELSEHKSWQISPGADFMQFAFVYFNSSENPEPKDIQLDNIRITGVTNCS